MTYVTQQDLVDRFGALELIQLTDRTNVPAEEIDAAVVAKHIADAEALIDSYVAKRYALPLAVVPPVLTKYAADLARYFLHGDSAEKDGAIERGHRAAIGWLEQVAKGFVVIEAAGEIPSQAGGGQIQVAGPERIFSRETLEGL